MKTLTGYLPKKYRSAVRFVLVGALGTGLQYGIYYLLLEFFHARWPQMAILRVRPNWKNAGGFVLGRTLNYFIQMLLLHVLILLEMSEQWAGIAAIALAGVINYFVLQPFYKEKQREA